eukprot:TRINITY_DN7527_c1_g1_i1.p1 TRINITY_DN7527_c1_g1~~TRINITY_DN7527_c1_g1_i1.p1  ORF type:complete len:535 (+),score=68.91 TRINITY_DN7527_c1_g1_i1:79-1683(+)
MASHPFPYLEIFIVFTACVTAWELYLDMRQRNKNRETERPDEIKDLAPLDQFTKSQLYQVDKLGFSMFSKLVSFSWNVVEIVFLWPLFWNLSKLVLGDNEYCRAITWQLMISFVNFPITIPLGLYSDFVIEAKHGFNKKTVRLFITDTMKGLFLSVLMTVLLIPAVIYVVHWGGDQFYLYMWIMCQILMFVLMFIFPTLIMPLFNKYEPLRDPSLRGQIEALATTLQFPLTKLFQMDGSKRSAHSNAFMFGFWKNKRIVIFDTLLQTQVTLVKKVGQEIGCTFTLDGLRMKVQQFSTGNTSVSEWNEVHRGRNDELRDGDIIVAVGEVDEADKMIEAANKHANSLTEGTLNLILERTPFTSEEILAVLCHEIGHWFHSHVLRMLVISSVHIFIIFRLYGFVMNSADLFESFGFSNDDKSIIVGLNIFMLMFTPVETVVSFGMTLLTRMHEYQADDFAVKQGRGEHLQSCLRKLCIENLGDLNPDPWYAWFHHSHPALVERLNNIKAKAEAFLSESNKFGTESDAPLLSKPQVFE